MLKNKLLITLGIMASPFFAVADTLEPIPFEFIYEGETKSKSQEQENSTYIYPNVLTRTPISISDFNQITCKNGKITDRVFSSEKPLIFNPNKSKEIAFVKLQAKQNSTTGKILYYTDAVDLYITCDDEIYSLLLVPAKVHAQHIILDGGRGKELAQKAIGYKELELEEVIVDMLDKVHSEDQITGTFHKVNNPDAKWIDITRNTKGLLQSSYNVEGIGIAVHKIALRSIRADTLHETDLLKANLKKNIIAVRVYKHALPRNGKTTAYIVTREF